MDIEVEKEKIIQLDEPTLGENPIAKWDKDQSYCEIIPINRDATINGGTYKIGYS